MMNESYYNKMVNNMIGSLLKYTQILMNESTYINNERLKGTSVFHRNSIIWSAVEPPRTGGQQ